MAVYSWRKRPTKHFGDVWVPFAHIKLQDTSGRFQALALQIDSGATVSLMRRSVADLLGIDLKSGKRIDLTGVGGASLEAYVHGLTAQLEEDWPPFEIPFAIASSESVPNLLGRLGVFDRLQVDFDASLTHTTLSAPWLGPLDRKIWESLLSTETHILNRLGGAEVSGEVWEAIRRMITQAGLLTASVAGLARLHRADGSPPLVRSLFELAAQYEFLLQKPDERATQYLAFEHVTRYLQSTAFIRDPVGPLARRLAASPHRKEGEPRVKAEFDRVCPLFLKPDGKRLWKNWYKIEQFRQLVEALPQDRYPWAREYVSWYKQYSGWAHGEPFEAGKIRQKAEESEKREARKKGSDWLLECYFYYARMLLRTADSFKLVLTNEQHELLTKLSEGLT